MVGIEPPFKPLYSLSRPELKGLNKWLPKNLAKGFIRASLASCEAPILFFIKKGGSLQLCVDYQKLNGGTLKNQYLLSLIRYTLIQSSKIRSYTKLDGRNTYNLLRIVLGYRYKTTSRSPNAVAKSHGRHRDDSV